MIDDPDAQTWPPSMREDRLDFGSSGRLARGFMMSRFMARLRARLAMAASRQDDPAAIFSRIYKKNDLVGRRGERAGPHRTD